MLHEPVTLDGYGALMIPAKVSELGGRPLIDSSCSRVWLMT